MKWLVLTEESGISGRLVVRLEVAGAEVVSVRRGHGYERAGEKQCVIKSDREEYERLVEELADQTGSHSNRGCVEQHAERERRKKNCNRRRRRY